MCFLYILQSVKSGKHYIGSTNNLERRLLEHSSGQTKYTNENGPFQLVFKSEFSQLSSARKAEAWLKRQKSRSLVTKIIF